VSGNDGLHVNMSALTAVHNNELPLGRDVLRVVAALVSVSPSRLCFQTSVINALEFLTLNILLICQFRHAEGTPNEGTTTTTTGILLFSRSLKVCCVNNNGYY